MECRHCGGNKFRRVPRALVLQETVSKLGFAAWQCHGCQKICVVRHHGLAMVADDGPVLAMVTAMEEASARATAKDMMAPQKETGFTTVSPAHGCCAPRPVPVP